MGTSRKKKFKTHRINEQLRLELLKLKTPEPEPVIANDSNEMIRNGNKYVFNEQMGSLLKVVDPFSAVYTKKRPDQ